MKSSRIFSAIIISLILLVSCNKEEPVIIADISVNKTEINLGRSSAEAQAYLEISSTYDWSAVANADWISLSKSNGNAATQYKILVKANTNELTEKRETKIIITSGSSKKEVAVIQERGVMTMSASQVPNYDRIYNSKGEDRLSLSSDGKWFYGRSKQSEHFIIFWEKAYGEFGETSPSECSDSKFRVNIDDLLDWAEKCYDQNVNVLKFAESGATQLDNWKFEIFLQYSTVWAAYGWGLENTVGCLWLNPDAANSKATIAHEIGHSFQYQTYCDLLYKKEIKDQNITNFRYDRGENGTGFWEQTAQWQAAHMCPEEAFGSWYFSGTSGTSFCENAHRHFLHEDMRYGSYFLHYYWKDKYGITSISDIWKASKAPQDALQVHQAIHGLSLDDLNSELYEYAAKVVTWDFNDLRDKGTSHLNKISWKADRSDDGWYKVLPECCPEATGFNIIRLQSYIAGEELTLHFEGLPNASGYNKSGDASVSGWTIGFVALGDDWKTRWYSEPVLAGHAGGNIADASWTVPAGTKRLWAVVCVTPSKYLTHLWDENNSNDRLWPYRIKLDGATAVYK